MPTLGKSENATFLTPRNSSLFFVVGAVLKKSPHLFSFFFSVSFLRGRGEGFPSMGGRFFF